MRYIFGQDGKIVYLEQAEYEIMPIRCKLNDDFKKNVVKPSCTSCRYL